MKQISAWFEVCICEQPIQNSKKVKAKSQMSLKLSKAKHKVKNCLKKSLMTWDKVSSKEEVQSKRKIYFCYLESTWAKNSSKMILSLKRQKKKKGNFSNTTFQTVWSINRLHRTIPCNKKFSHNLQLSIEAVFLRLFRIRGFTFMMIILKRRTEMKLTMRSIR